MMDNTITVTIVITILITKNPNSILYVTMTKNQKQLIYQLIAKYLLRQMLRVIPQNCFVQKQSKRNHDLNQDIVLVRVMIVVTVRMKITSKELASNSQTAISFGNLSSSEDVYIYNYVDNNNNTKEKQKKKRKRMKKLMMMVPILMLIIIKQKTQKKTKPVLTNNLTESLSMVTNNKTLCGDSKLALAKV